jgi:cytochrome c peroxidase
MRRAATARCGMVGAAIAAAIVGTGCDVGSFFCGSDAMCGWSETDLSRVTALANLPSAPPVDGSNAYATDPNAVALGKMFYFDTRFSGPSNWLDGLNRVMPFGRTAIGQSAGVGCISCHDSGHGGADPASNPGDVSVGAGWTYNNSITTFDSAYYLLHLWNGRSDSLWAQAVADNENPLTTNGNRLRTAWLIASLYGASSTVSPNYPAVFTNDPLPFDQPLSAVQALVDTTGQCALVGGACPTGCREVTSTVAGAAGGCWPRFPLQGKPGKMAGCQSGLASEPFGDAWDCMDPADQTAITRVLVNFGKSIAAYEATLILEPSKFDEWVADLQAGRGDSSTAIPGPAKIGAQLFVGKAGCSDCHNTPLFSDDKFHNVGVGQIGAGVPTVDDCPTGGVCDCASASPKNCLPFGARDGIQKLQANGFRRDSVWSDDPSDTSAMSYVNADLDSIPEGAYRTPSLRNVSMTAPYMHDGSIATLADVVWHYTQGITDENTPGAPAASFKPLYLSADEQSALVAFLVSLASAPPADVIAPPTLP